MFTNQWLKDFKNHLNRCLTSSLLLQKELVMFDLVSAPSSTIPCYLFASQLFKTWSVRPANMGSGPQDCPLVIGSEPGQYQTMWGFMSQGIQLNQKGHIQLPRAALLENCSLPISQRRQGPVLSECQLYGWCNIDGNKVLIFKCLLISYLQEKS